MEGSHLRLRRIRESGASFRRQKSSGVFLAGTLLPIVPPALDRSADLRARAAKLDAKLINSGLSQSQQSLIAHGTRSYYGSTQLLDIGGQPFWVVNEGE